MTHQLASGSLPLSLTRPSRNNAMGGVQRFIAEPAPAPTTLKRLLAASLGEEGAASTWTPATLTPCGELSCSPSRKRHTPAAGACATAVSAAGHPRADASKRAPAIQSRPTANTSRTPLFTTKTLDDHTLSIGAWNRYNQHAKPFKVRACPASC